MFPESFAMVIRNQGSTSAQPGGSVTAEEGAHVGTSHAVAASPNQIQAALRIRAALRAALQDAAEAKMGLKFLEELRRRFPAPANATKEKPPNGTPVKPVSPASVLEQVEQIAPGFQAWAKGFREQ